MKIGSKVLITNCEHSWVAANSMATVLKFYKATRMLLVKVMGFNPQNKQVELQIPVFTGQYKEVKSNAKGVSKNESSNAKRIRKKERNGGSC